MKKLILLLLVVFGISQISFAQDFRARQKSQVKVIKTAYKKGRITQTEYDKLMREQYVIEETIDKYNADGYLDASEKNKIHDKLVRAEKRLRRYKHNGEIY